MPDVYVARQPIFDRAMRVTGYELLFRDASGNRPDQDDDNATTAVVLNSLTEIGLKQIVGTRQPWIRVSPSLIDDGLVDLLPSRAVLELPAGTDAGYELMNTLDELRRRGHLVALGRFSYTPEVEPLLRLADFVKLDLIALGRGQLRRQAARVKRVGLKLLATRVENAADHAVCKEAGCHLFQGYFYCRPEIMQSRRIDASRLAVLELLAILQDPRVQVEELEKRIALDVGLSVRLLRYINSAFFGLRQPVRSIAQAIALLGIDRMRRWTALTLIASIDEKPPELTVVALARARFCELAAEQNAIEDTSEPFTVGLFSVLDALFDLPMEEALRGLPLAQETHDAILQHAGPMGDMLECLIALQTAEFGRAEAIMHASGKLYLSALAWADATARSLAG